MGPQWRTRGSQSSTDRRCRAILCALSIKAILLGCAAAAWKRTPQVYILSPQKDFAPLVAIRSRILAQMPVAGAFIGVMSGYFRLLERLGAPILSGRLDARHATGNALARIGAGHFSVDLRPPRLRLSTPANQRFVSTAPNRRRSPSRRSAFLRNLHEQLFGIEQAASGRRGASRSR